MRQFCNFAYAVMVEGMDEKQRRDLDKALATPPGEPVLPAAHGTSDLMAMLGPGGAGRRG